MKQILLLPVNTKFFDPRYLNLKILKLSSWEIPLSICNRRIIYLLLTTCLCRCGIGEILTKNKYGLLCLEMVLVVDLKAACRACPMHIILLILPEHLSSSLLFIGVRVAPSLVFYVMSCRSWFVLFLFVIVLSVLLRFTASDYIFGIFKLFHM